MIKCSFAEKYPTLTSKDTIKILKNGKYSIKTN